MQLHTQKKPGEFTTGSHLGVSWTVNVFFFISTVLFVAASHLLIRLGNKTGDAAVSLQKLLKLLVTDDEPLGLSQGFLSCVLPINQQTLEHLNTGSTDGIR